MDWSRAKTIVIVVLVVLNGVLFMFNYDKNSTYRISSQQENAIMTILNNNDISFDTDIIKESYPMRVISVDAKELDIEAIKTLFFYDENVDVSIEFNDTILESEDIRISINNNFMEYTNKNADIVSENINHQYAIDIVQDYINNFDLFDGYIIDTVTEQDGIYVVEILRIIDGYKFFNTTAKFIVDTPGIVSFSCNFYENETDTSDLKNICKADEALLTFVHEANDTSITPTTIIDMELGYDLATSGDISNRTSLNLYPVYRIYTGENGSDFLIDGYTNKMR